MSKYQRNYNQARKKEVRIMVPEIQSQIKDLEVSKRTATDPDIKKGIDARIKALKIKMKSYKEGDPVKEEAQGAIATGSIGVGTAVTNTGETIPSPTGSSYLHPKHMGTFSRRDGYKAPVHDDGRKKKKKKKKKKKNESFVEHYFEECAINEWSTRLNFDSKYLVNKEDLVDGKLYVVTNKLPLGSFKNKISSTWVDRDDVMDALKDHFTDVYPFKGRYGLVYDLVQQIEDEFGSK